MPSVAADRSRVALKCPARMSASLTRSLDRKRQATLVFAQSVIAEIEIAQVDVPKVDVTETEAISAKVSKAQIVAFRTDPGTDAAATAALTAIGPAPLSIARLTGIEAGFALDAVAEPCNLDFGSGDPDEELQLRGLASGATFSADVALDVRSSR